MKFKIVGIKLMSHATKLLERIENRMRYETEITEQFGYIPGRGTTDVIFALRNMVKKKKKAISRIHAFRRKKTYDRVPQEEIWRYVRKKYQKCM